MMKNNWMERLNEAQLESVVTCDQPLRIVAGAGSGKTRVITTKIVYLISALNIYPSRILAVTFTNKAANEMKERVREMIGSENGEPFISTFHALCTRILRIEAENCNLQKNFTIIDDSRQQQIVRKIVKEEKIDIKSHHEIKKMLYPIEKWKNSFVDPIEAAQFATSELDRRNAKIYKLYERELELNNYVDFNDLLLKVHRLFNQNKAILEKWQGRFDYILVDEFQDTNQIQFDIIFWLNAGRKGITVVGDPDQTIYSWRGAEMRIIMDFEKKFKNAKTIQLEMNYRSTQKILELANQFIDHNKDRIQKNLYSINEANFPIQLSSAQTSSFEARYVANQIKELVADKGYKYSDIFVLYRINALSANFERAFSNSKIPFKMVGGLEFRDRKVIKDLSSMLLAVQAQDSYATERVLALIPKVGAVTIAKIGTEATAMGISIFNLMVEYPEVVLSISKNMVGAIKAFTKGLKMYQENRTVKEIVKVLISEFEYDNLLKVTSDNYIDSKEHIQAYFDQMDIFMDNFDSEEHGTENYLDAFCQSDLLGKNAVQETAINAVSLMTIHAAKGLESKVVFIVGVNEGIFPSSRAQFSTHALEEERRALYVAITRAKERLYITYVNGEYSNMTGGNLHESRFLRELNHDFLEVERDIFFHSINEMSSNLGPATEEASPDIVTDLQVGDIINHMLFGQGVVTKILGRQFIAAFNDPQWKVQTVPINSEVWKKI